MKKMILLTASLILLWTNLFAQTDQAAMKVTKQLTERWLMPSDFVKTTDTAQNSNVTLIGRWPYGPCYAVDVVNNIAYIGNGSALEILDISNPANPVKLGQVVTPSVVSGIKVSGNYAYVADESDGLRIIDVSNPTNPQEVGFFDTGSYARGVSINGNYAYVADESDGLRIIDVSNPTSPQADNFTQR